MIELLVLCVLYVVIWGILIPVLKYACVGLLYVLLAGVFIYETLTKKDCSWFKEKGLRLFYKLRYRT